VTATNSPTSSPTNTGTSTPTSTPTQPVVAVSIGTNNPGASTQIPGAVNVPILQLKPINASGESVTFSFMIFNSPGAQTDNSISAVKLWKDVDGSGTVDGTSVFIDSQLYTNHAVTFGRFPIDTLASTAQQNYLLTYSFSSSATP